MPASVNEELRTSSLVQQRSELLDLQVLPDNIINLPHLRHYSLVDASSAEAEDLSLQDTLG